MPALQNMSFVYHTGIRLQTENQIDANLIAYRLGKKFLVYIKFFKQLTDQPQYLIPSALRKELHLSPTRRF